MCSILNILHRTIFSLACVCLLCAWTIGGSPLDETGTISGVKSCTSSVADTALDSGVYSKASAGEECHRWGMKWMPFSGTTLDDVRDTFINPESGNTAPEDSEFNWQIMLQKADPDDSGNTRLPTIKELVRIFEYNSDPLVRSSAGVPIGDHVFRAWLQADENSDATLTGYLISSTYRHINCGELNGSTKRIRYLGVEIGTGKVVAFNGALKLCGPLDDSAACTLRSDVAIYALLVGNI